MKSFIVEAVRTIKTTGMIVPSSRYLIEECLKDLSFTDAKTIIEFGAGNGCITEELAKRIQLGSKLFSFEINKKFYEHCLDRFAKYSDVHIVNKSAQDFNVVLDETHIEKVDLFVSSLPLSLLEDNEIRELLKKIKYYIKPNGIFIQYQYSLRKYKVLKQTFDKINVSLIIRNFPPAFIYKCYQKPAANSLEEYSSHSSMH